MIFCNLKEILKNNNVTATALANETKISRNTINQLVNNKTNGIQFDTLSNICTYLGITLSDLLIYSPYDFSFSVLDITTGKDNNLYGKGKLIIHINECAKAIPITSKNRVTKFDISLDVNIETMHFENTATSLIVCDFPNIPTDTYLLLQSIFTQYSPKISNHIVNIIEETIAKNELVSDFRKAYKDVRIIFDESLSPLFDSNEPIKPQNMINALSLILNKQTPNL